MTESEHIELEQLQAFIDQELDADEKKSVALHLAECAVCTREHERLRELFQEIESLPIVELDRDLSPAVLEAIRSKKISSLTMRMIPLLQAVSGVTLFWLLWPVIQSGLLRVSASLSQWTIWVWIHQEAFSIQNGLVESVFWVRGWMESVFASFVSHVPQWPISAWWLVMGCVFSLWVLGNGFLLRNIEKRMNRR